MSRHVTFATWEDVPHLSEEAKASLRSAYMPHEREARTKGVPSLGSGAIYPVAESDITVEPFITPAWYRHVYALDVGWNRTAALWGALDPETDILYLTGEYYRGQAEPAVHAEAIRSRGLWIPGVIDPASRGSSQKDGEALLTAYKGQGLNLSLADNAVEAGIYQMYMRMTTGRFKAFRTLQSFWGEFRIYRRDEKGKIVKENDHLMDCGRYLCMSGIQRAVPRPREEWASRPGMPVRKHNPDTHYDMLRDLHPPEPERVDDDDWR
jgi:hypothetical protein